MMLRTPIARLALLAAVTFSLSAKVARADKLRLEIGVFGGGHFFSTTNELGRPDAALEGTAPDHFVVFGPRIGLALSRWITLEAEGAFIPTTTRDSRADVLVVGYRGHLLLHLIDAKVRPFLLAGGGAMTSFSSSASIIGDDTDPLFHFGGGLKFELSDTWALRLDGRVLLPPSTTPNTLVTTDFEGLLGFSAGFGGGAEAPPPAAPQPEPKPSDRDEDGFADLIDKCPSEAEDFDGQEDDDGCPDPDNDHDGMPDVLDKCPNESGPKENYGCPDQDRDKDGVVDRLDKCADQPESKNGFQDEDGCPDEVPQAVAQFTGVIEGITFKTGSAVIASSSFPTLDRAVKVMKEYPSIRLEISGHTDNRGKHDKNVWLSEQRAESVRQYLIKQGIEENRLTAVGYGPDRPIASNKNARGRSRNRRVEFQLIK